ncbi:uncharacterized protein EKO05_0010014 [Ascochyta rabiei]|uniref:uncharacterized protein n=1 Tax=Didymella rabiei TaxID=5454 RepID=UPI0021FDAF82|nr:uncharacterized protein EKO05_0010014 [Ascochyta rabiei]UPX19762.1 hypothetical protein EKO05_0010014 [Ascochyta rabiei]
MAGGRRNLRLTTSDVEELPPRDDLGQEPDAQRRDDAPRVSPAPMEPPLNPHIRGGSATTAAGIATPDVPTPRVTQMELLQASIPLLLEALNEAELSGAPEREIEIRQRQFNRAVETLQRTHVGPTPGSHRPAFDEAGKIMRVLNNVQPKPQLGTDNKPLSTQQVDQWIKDIDTAFQYAQVVEDSVTRTYWIMGTIYYSVHRELIQQRINEGSIRTWADLRAEEEQLVQDPVFTQYENYDKYFNYEWKADDSVNTFLMKLNKRESLLPRNFAKFDDGTDDYEFKIAFVWSLTPHELQREIQRNGSLEHITEWIEFERALRNAETATVPLNSSLWAEGSGRNKRPYSSPNRGGFKRHHSRASTPSGSDAGKQPGDSRPATNNANSSGGKGSHRDNYHQQSNRGGYYQQRGH